MAIAIGEKRSNTVFYGECLEFLGLIKESVLYCVLGTVE